MKCVWSVLLLFFVLSAQAAFAAEFPAQARLFLGSTNANPTDLNQEMTTLGLTDFKSIGKYGAEITYPLARFLDVGMRYEKRSLANKELTPTANADYRALLNQDAVLLLARVPFWKNDFVRLDVFGGVGGTNTTLNIRSATQSGELTRRESKDWFASLYTSVGGSVAIGYKSVYFFIEGGVESNKVDTLKRSENFTSSIQTLQLSGGYASVGLMFDGIKARSK